MQCRIRIIFTAKDDRKNRPKKSWSWPSMASWKPSVCSTNCSRREARQIASRTISTIRGRVGNRRQHSAAPSRSGLSSWSGTGPDCVKTHFRSTPTRGFPAGCRSPQPVQAARHASQCSVLVWRWIRRLPRRRFAAAAAEGAAAYRAIASIIGTTPMIRITRFKLYASTCKLISVLTCSSVRVRKCV